jgi:hypothetical protein
MTVLKHHERGYVTADGRYLVEKEELLTECHCAERPYPLDRCNHENGEVEEVRWFVYDLSKAKPDDPATLLDGRASGLTDSVFDAATLKEVRGWLA